MTRKRTAIWSSAPAWLYEDRLGEQRSAIQSWLGEFEQALDTQDPRAIRHARQQMREALDSIDGGFRF